MNIRDIERLVELMHSAQIGEIEYKRGAAELRLRFSRSPAPDPLLHSHAADSVAPADENATVIVRAPATGTFSRAHPLRDNPEFQLGDRVAAGQPVGFIGIESILCPVPAPKDGRLLQQIAEDGSLVGYGDALAEIELQGPLD